MKLSLLVGVALVLATASVRAGTLTDAVDGSLVHYDKNKVEKVAPGSLANKKIIAFYFSAHWCPPCRAFTPELVKEYKSLARKYPQFELIFVSADKSEAEMTEYMDWGKMDWPAIEYSKARQIPQVNALSARGIPYLVVVDADGKVLADKGSEDWVSPDTILEKLKEILKKS